MIIYICNFLPIETLQKKELIVIVVQKQSKTWTIKNVYANELVI